MRGWLDAEITCGYEVLGGGDACSSQESRGCCIKALCNWHVLLAAVVIPYDIISGGPGISLFASPSPRIIQSLLGREIRRGMVVGWLVVISGLGSSIYPRRWASNDVPQQSTETRLRLAVDINIAQEPVFPILVCCLGGARGLICQG